MYGVAAITKDDIWAVGDHNNGLTGSSLVEHWNGSTWQIVPVPNVGALHAIAKVASIVPTTELWAVGDLGTLHYANGTWNADYSVSGMKGVVAPDASHVWAVGSSVRFWNGSQWSTQPAPGGAFNAITTASQSDSDMPLAWAVGYQGNSPNRQPLAIYWNGQNWTTMVTPALPGDSLLNGVDLFASNNIWAVGIYLKFGIHHTLTEHWDGFNWSVITSPDGDTNAVYSELHSVWYNTEGDVWAAGSSSDSSPGTDLRTLILRWTDLGWQKVDSPNLGMNSELLGIGTISGAPVFDPPLPGGAGNPVSVNGAWAVGRQQDSVATTYGTLIERITAPTPTAYATPQSQSYYEHTIYTTDHYQQGCLAAHNGDSGIIILDYGKPIIYKPGPPPLYGALLPAADNSQPTPASIPDITNAAKNFVNGYHDAFYPPPYPSLCQQAAGVPPTVVLALGINNFNMYNDAELTTGHAQAWAHAVATVQAYAAGLLTPLPNMTVVAGLDFEPQWSAYNNGSGRDAHTWAAGYNSTPTSDYYNFGSTSGYPAPAPGDPSPPIPLPWCCSAWSVDQLYELSWALPGAHSLPEIYRAQASRTWYQIKRWAYDHNLPVTSVLKGEITECADGGCHSPDFNWAQAGQVLWQELNADPRFLMQQNLPFSTDIKQR